MSKNDNTKALPALFGDLVPYGDPSWYQGFNSPYYKESHIRLRKAMREWVDNKLMGSIHEWVEARQMPKTLFKEAFNAGWLPGVIGPPWPHELIGDRIIGDVPAGEFDAFHELIIVDELSRCGSGGIMWGLSIGISIGVPPILAFGTEEMKKNVCIPCLRGEKVISLCITEPGYGSDVANLATTAQKTPDGKHYIVSGQKKFITCGTYADFFTVAVRTGGAGSGGVSLLLIERNRPGVSVRPMEMQGVWASGTSYVDFDDVKVPVSNLIGKENNGFKYIMHNFNHERWILIVQSARFARVCLEEAMTYAQKRKTFGKKLIEHPVIRFKLAHMARQVESMWALVEHVTYQLKVMPKTEANTKLGGMLALLKVHCTQTFEYCAREAAQIFGGLSYTRGGQGEKVERLYRDVRAYAIGGGSEEVMLDMAIRRAIAQAKPPSSL